MTTSKRLGSGLLIGDVARLCGISTRAVRHYHSAGLLAEPPRDSSGYRRYGTAEVIALVRIARLRALGMPVPTISARLNGGDGMVVTDDLKALADELTAEIVQLSQLRDRIAAAVDAQALADPASALAGALREYGRLSDEDDLMPAEAEAARLVDALHPGGMTGAIDAAQELLRDPGKCGVLDGLLRRVRALTDTTDAAEIQALAAGVAAALPHPDQAPPPVDVAVMDGLLGDRLNAGQRRFMVELRRLLDDENA